VINGLGMGLAATFVLVCSNVLISLIRKFVPVKIRIPVYIVVIASFVTIIDLSMAGFAPALHKSLGIFVPLIVVNCIILGRAEAFAGKNTAWSSFLDGIGMGVGFTLGLILMGTIRELLGNGTFLGYPVLGSSFNPVLIMILPPGALLTIGFLMGFFNWLEERKVKG
jgi:electron transport complex protein RnfE